jgi:hypothetical protein
MEDGMRRFFVVAAAILAVSLLSIEGVFAEDKDSINYNASKSNTGNVTATDHNTGMSTGRRQHQPVTAAKHHSHKAATKSHRHHAVKHAAKGTAHDSDMAVKTTGVPEH